MADHYHFSSNRWFFLIALELARQKNISQDIRYDKCFEEISFYIIAAKILVLKDILEPQ